MSQDSKHVSMKGALPLAWLRKLPAHFAAPPVEVGDADAAGSLQISRMGTELGLPLPFRAVRTTLGHYRTLCAQELRLAVRAGFPKGKRRRDWQRKADDLERCGQRVLADQCGGCGHYGRARVECSCGLRICPTCARRRSGVYRDRLVGKYEHRVRHPNMDLYFITFTTKYDPRSAADLNCDALRARKDAVAAGVRYCWRTYLQPRTYGWRGEGGAWVKEADGGTRVKAGGMAVAIEVGAAGAVHAHALYYGRRPDQALLRATYLTQNPDSPWVDIKYVRRGKATAAIVELAKYLTKAASPKRARILRGEPGSFMHPALAARVEIAFAGARLLQCYGAFRGVDDDDDLDEEAPASCTACGTVGCWNKVSMPMAEWLPMAPEDWIPGFVRAGPPGCMRKKPSAGSSGGSS